MAGAIVIAGILGMNPPGFAAQVVALAFGLAASSIFPVLMMGIFYKKMNKEGAIAGMIAGLGVTLLYVFQHKGIMFIASTAYLGNMPENWFLGIEPNAFGAIGALINFVVAILVSKMTTEPPEQALLLFIQTEIGTPTPPALGFGTTSALAFGNAPSSRCRWSTKFDGAVTTSTHSVAGSLPDFRMRHGSGSFWQ